MDPSKHMNDLARFILGGGDGLQTPAGISFRLQNPSSVNLQYNLVLCSNTLLELPTMEKRLTSIHNLWARVGEEGYLVLVETGTNALNDLFQLSKRMKCGDELPVNLKEWIDKPKKETPWMKRKQTQD